MKAIFLVAGICIFLFTGTPALFGQQNDPGKTKVEQAIRKAIAGGRYKIVVDRADPAGGKPVSLTSGYSLEINNDSVFSYLPYFGRAYNIPYGGGQGLIFQSPITTYQAVYHKKGKVNIDFTVANQEDTYRFFIVLFDNGSADIRIRPVKRQAISFKGNLELPEALR